MNITCPKCRRPIPTVDINVEKDIALCRNCNETFSFSELLEETSVPDTDLERPPKGFWFRRNGMRFEMGATTRSAMAFFLVPFMCVWSGFSLGGIYGTQIYSGKFNLVMSLFGIPFLLGTILFGSIAVMSACGKVVVTVDGDEGSVFTGVWRIGWVRRFKWSGVRTVEEDWTQYRSNGRSMRIVVLKGDKQLRFGSGLSDERREFMVGALKLLLRDRKT